MRSNMNLLFIIIFTYMAKAPLATAEAGSKSGEAKKADLTVTAPSKAGRVINTPPGQARPILREKQSKQNQLLDFKTAKAPWLSQYPTIQKKISDIIQKEKQEVLKEAKKLFQEFPRSALLPYRLYVEELKLFRPDKKKDTVSVRMKLYFYTGGAHGGSQYYSWNYNLKKQKFVSLDDILNAKQFAKLIQQTRKLLFEHEKQGNPYDRYIKKDIQKGTSKKKHFKIWNLRQKEIVIIFPEYQVGPYAAGSFEVFIPLNLIVQ